MANNIQEECKHVFTPNYVNLFKPPSCEKCGKVLNFEKDNYDFL